MIETSVTNRNLIRLLRAGAFGLNEGETEPMSAYKWNALFDIAEKHEVSSYVIEGARLHLSDRWFNYKGNIDEIEYPEETDILKNAERILRIGVKDVDGLYTTLSNARMRKTLEDIIRHEMHSDEKNIPALLLLCVLVYNINVTLTQGMSMNGIVAIGRFLRDKGDKVDFVKLESWIKKLMMGHFCNLLGSVLVMLFDFDESEIPFMHSTETNVSEIVNTSLCLSPNKEVSSSYLLQLSSGFVNADGTNMRQSMKRGLRYMKYYPAETVSNFFSKFFKNLPDVEE